MSSITPFLFRTHGGGRRILRLFVNINPTDPRIWATSLTFAQVFGRYGRLVGLPGGDADGQAMLGAALHLGAGVPRDAGAALVWLMRARAGGRWAAARWSAAEM